jgi:hypothetical protein
LLEAARADARAAKASEAEPMEGQPTLVIQNPVGPGR